MRAINLTVAFLFFVVLSLRPHAACGQCQPSWQAGDQPPFPGAVTALAESDDGTLAAHTASSSLTGPCTVTRFQSGGWQQLGGSFDWSVSCLLDDPSGPLAGGQFLNVDSQPSRFIARWDGAVWQPMGDGLDGSVHALTHFNGDVIAVGGFTHSGTQSVNGVARWDGAAWHQVGDGLLGNVSALLVWNGTLYAGGAFQFPATGLASVARLTNGIWERVGPYLGHEARALAAYNGELIAGGLFNQMPATLLHYIARFDGSLWQPLGNDQANGLSNHVLALTVIGPDLIAAGDFASTWNGFVGLAHIARWNGAQWSYLNSGLDGFPAALLDDHNTLYVGGSFTHAGPQVSPYLARWSCSCYANCDGSASAPTLNVADFMCFLNQFAAGLSLPPAQQVTSYANCDGSTASPALTVLDFACFQQRFAAGCP